MPIRPIDYWTDRFLDFRMRLGLPIMILLLAAFFAMSITAGVSFGAAPIPFATVWSIVGNKLHAGLFGTSVFRASFWRCSWGLGLRSPERCCRP